MKIIRLVSLFSLLLFVVGCSSEPVSIREAIIGKWQSNSDGEGTLEFFEDGRVIIVGEGQPFSIPARYVFTSDDVVRVENESFAHPLTWKVSISNDELTLSLAEGDSDTFQRIDN